MKKIAMGRAGGWDQHVMHFLDRAAYAPVFVDFADFDLGAVDYAVPLTLEDAACLRQNHGDRHSKYLIPSAEVTARCADKKDFCEWALANGFAANIPPVYPPGTRQFPYVLKHRRLLSGVGIFPIRDAGDEAAHGVELNDDSYFCQAYVPGRVECATHILFGDDGQHYHSSNMYQMAGEFAVKGNDQRPVREWFGVFIADEVIGLMANILAALGFHGTCSLDYKIFDGRLRLLELNPRIGSSLFRDINAYLRAYIATLERTR